MFPVNNSLSGRWLFLASRLTIVSFDMPIVKTDKKPGTLEMVAIVIATHLFSYFFTLFHMRIQCV